MYYWKKINVSDSDNCSVCNAYLETIKNLFWDVTESRSQCFYNGLAGMVNKQNSKCILSL
jgi:hypothetical protein